MRVKNSFPFVSSADNLDGNVDYGTPCIGTRIQTIVMPCGSLDDEIRAGRERVHTNELVKGDCPSTRKQSHRFTSIYPSIGLSLAEHVHFVSPYTFLSLFSYAGILAAVRGCASYLRLTPLCNVQIIE